MLEKEVSTAAFKLRLPKSMRIHDVFHVSMLKPYRTDLIVIDGELAQEVEAVRAHREKKGRGRKVKREMLD